MIKLATFMLLSSWCYGQSLDTTALTEAFKSAYEKYAPLGSVELVTNFVLKFKVLPEEQHATCEYKKYGSKPPIVTLSFFGWETMSTIQREIVFFHELAHCLLKRPHRNQFIIRDGEEIPISIMNAIAISDREYIQNKDYYLEELFFHKE